MTFKEWLYTAALLIFQYIYAGVSQVILSLLGVKFIANSNTTVLSGSHRWAIFFSQAFNSLFQLMMEEFFGIFIFLAMTAILMQQFKLNRNTAIWGSLIVSMFVFGLAHFAVYDWNLPQMLFVIGVERILMTGAYLHSKSIWASFAMHYLFDTSGFLVATLTSAFMLYPH